MPERLSLHHSWPGGASHADALSFGQLCTPGWRTPASYLRQLPAPLAGINLQHGLLSHRAELVKTLEAEALAGSSSAPSPGRITVASGTTSLSPPCGASPATAPATRRWKVPGVLDWSTMTHNPLVDVTAETTTLYASPTGMFSLFLVDDTHPIEAGRLPNGEPDLYFRGFYAWNSEVGSKTLGIASFYLRGVCQNRNLWGVEGFEEITIRHSKFAAQRFAHEAAPALTSFANSEPGALRCRDQGGAGARSSPGPRRTGRPSCASAASPAGDGPDHRDRAERGGASAREPVRFRTGDHRAGPDQAAPGRAA